MRTPNHDTHGRESPDGYPHASYCPCTGVAPLSQQIDCADGGCRRCRAALAAPKGARRILESALAADAPAEPETKEESE